MSQRPVPCGIAIPQMFPGGPTHMELIRRHAARAEELGFHSLWVQEQIIGSTSSLEPISLLCYVAALTDRVRLGTAVVVATTRNPVHLAKEFSTLDQMSDGRLIVGLALGGRRRHYPLLGGPSERRVRHFVESLDVMKALWTQPEVSYEGSFWKLDGVAMEPKPVQKPHPPVWFGSRHPAGLRRAVRLANGWMGAGGTTPEEFREHVGIVREALGDSRDPASFPIAKRVYLAVDDDRDRAERRLREWFGPRYGSEDLGSRVSIWGSVSQCIEGLQHIVDAGAQMLMLNPVFDDIEHLEVLSRDVIPNLHLPQDAPPTFFEA